jgi:hypothetical protein
MPGNANKFTQSAMLDCVLGMTTSGFDALQLRMRVPSGS